MPEVEVQNAKINYSITGEGETLVLLTGLGGDISFWSRAVSQLSDHFKIITVDNRGAGKTVYQGEVSVEIMADDVIAIMDKESIFKAHIIGWSMGSSIALDTALRYPERVKTLTVISSYLYRPYRSKYILTHMVHALEAGMPKEYFGHLLNSFCLTEDTFKQRELAERPLNILSNYTKEGIISQVIAVENYNATGKAESVTVPTLSIHGLEDIMVEPRLGDELAECIRDCEILRIPGVGHMIPPNLYADRLIRFITSH